MFENRDLKLDLCALVLLALVVFLSLSLITYSPADPVLELTRPLDRLYQPDVLVYPGNEQVANACGRWGAFISDLLLSALGIGSYYCVLSLAYLDWRLLRREPLDSPAVRVTGWVLSLVGLVTLSALVAPTLSPGPVIGSGGYLGALGCAVLHTHFATAGGLIIAGSTLLGGLFLSTDYLLLRLAGKLASGLTTLLQRRSSTKPAAKAAAKSVATKSTAVEAADEEGDEQLEEEEMDSETEEVAVRIRGKKVDVEQAVEEDEEEEDEEEFEDEEEVAEDEDEEALVAAAATSEASADASSSGDKARSTGPHFRIKRTAEKNERLEVMEKLDQASLTEDAGDYHLPELDLLMPSDDICFESQAKEVRRKAKILEKTFADFGFNVKVVEIETGPVIAQYEVELEAGLRLSKITGLADDLAIALRVPSVRIVAPIPGKNTVGIEVPNETRQIVRLREVIEESSPKTKKMRIPLFLGKDVSGNALTVDLSTLPHLLIAGRTGTGKSVCLNAIISSILMTKRPDEVRMLMIDPKMVELSCYGRLPHLMHPVVTDMRKAEAILAWAVEKMEERYALLARAGVRHICSYNQLGEDELMERLQPETEEERQAIPLNLPFIVIVADEMADLMMTAGKEVEQHIIRLAQKSRAVGIHLILATQKPTVDVITGLIKSNLPARIAFQVASRTDSRVVLDEMGAERLLGNGDMLFLWPGTSTLIRGQGTYLDDDEINAVVNCVSTGEQNFVNELVNLKVEQPSAAEPGALKKRDELYEAAVDVVVREGRGSVSLLQRALGIGYGRAARLIDFMAEDGFVGTYAGSQAREVLISVEDWERMQAGGAVAAPQPAPPAPPAEPPRRTNKIVRPSSWDAEAEDEDEQPSEQSVRAKKSRTIRPDDEDEAPWEEDDQRVSARGDEYDEDEELEQEEFEDEDEGEDDEVVDEDEVDEEDDFAEADEEDAWEEEDVDGSSEDEGDESEEEELEEAELEEAEDEEEDEYEPVRRPRTRRRA